MKYTVYIEKSALKSLDKIPQAERDKIRNSILELALDPRPRGVKKLSGRDAWRIRIGNYRVIYEINDGTLVILVVVVGHRKNVYD